jgi:hypothetical protein
MWRVFTLCTLVACAPRGTEQLKRPAYVEEGRFGLCGTTQAVDADHVVWREGGCEGPIVLKNVGRASDAEFEELLAAFAALDAGYECIPDAGAPNLSELDERQLTYRVLRDDSVQSWASCGTDGGEPWRALGAAFDAL